MADRSHSDGGRVGRRSLLRSGESRCVPAGSAFTAVHFIAGAGEVVSDARRDELLTLVPLAVTLVGVVAHPSVGDDVVALGEPLGSLLSSTAIRDEIVEGRLQLREGVVGLLAVVLDPLPKVVDAYLPTGRLLFFLSHQRLLQSSNP